MDPSPKIRSFGGRFQVDSVIGQGGFATVYRAHDVMLGISVAVKVPHRQVDRMDRDQIEARFAQEWSLAAQLAHPGFPHIIAQGGEGAGMQSTPYYVMALVSGSELAQIIAEGPVPPRAAVAITIEVLESLYALHRLGYVHRDLKPNNLMLRRDGRVMVMDLGNAKATNRESARALGLPTQAFTAVHDVVASPGYAAPEQMAGEAEERSDFYALGVVLWQLLTGNTEIPKRLDRMHRPDGQVHANLVDVPEALRVVLLNVLRFDVEARSYRTAPEFIKALCEASTALRADDSAAFYKKHCPDAPSIPDPSPTRLPSFELVPPISDEPPPASVLRLPVTPIVQTARPVQSPTIVPPRMTSVQAPDADELAAVAALAPSSDATKPRRSTRRNIAIATVLMTVSLMIMFGVNVVVSKPPRPLAAEAVLAQSPVELSSASSPPAIAEPVAQSEPAAPPIKVTQTPDPPIKTAKSPIKPVVKVATQTPLTPVVTDGGIGGAPALPPTGQVKVPVMPAMIQLKGADGVISVPGTVPVGTYQIEAKFAPDASLTTFGKVTVSEGKTLRIVCDLDFQTCR